VVDYLKEINQALNADDPAYFRITDSPEMTAQFLLLYDSSGANEDLSDIKDFDNRYGRLVIPVKNMPASEMQTELDSITAYMNNNYSQLQPLLTGTMALKTVQDIYVSEGMVLSFSIALLVISILFIVLFRSIKYGLLSIVPSILPIILTASVASFMGIYMDQSTMIVGAMTMGIAVDDAIHVMNRYLVAKKSGATTQQSIEQAMNESGRAVLLSSMVLVCFALPALPP
jgi:predicted RND superfamily exporter protein